MPKAICKDCGSLVEAELTHNGVCEVGHYVHCGWGHDLSADELISDYAAYRIEELKGKLAKAVDNIENLIIAIAMGWDLEGVVAEARTTLEELEGQDDE